jgi:hypothetical protein
MHRLDSITAKVNQACDGADARLRPPRTHVWLLGAGLVVNILVASVFFLVPRGVVVGSPVFEPHNFSRNQTSGDYSLQLGVHIPVFNANYFQVGFGALVQSAECCCADDAPVTCVLS